jgi:hypothetical protein
MDVFDDDNGVIDQDTNRENQCKQRNPVQRKAPGPGGEQRGRQRQGHGNTDDHRLAPAERKENQQHDEGGGEDQLADQLLRLLGRCFAVIARYRDFNTFRITVFFRSFIRLTAALATSAALTPGCFEICNVTAGNSPSLLPNQA